MSNRVDLVSGSEHALGIGNRFGEHQQRIAHLLLACVIKVGHFESAGTLLLDRDRILQGVDLLAKLANTS